MNEDNKSLAEKLESAGLKEDDILHIKIKAVYKDRIFAAELLFSDKTITKTDPQWVSPITVIEHQISELGKCMIRTLGKNGICSMRKKEYCIVCDKEFFPEDWYKNSEYCSDECRQNA